MVGVEREGFVQQTGRAGELPVAHLEAHHLHGLVDPAHDLAGCVGLVGHGSRQAAVLEEHPVEVGSSHRVEEPSAVVEGGDVIAELGLGLVADAFDFQFVELKPRFAV